jgi:hypothetical protein
MLVVLVLQVAQKKNPMMMSMTLVVVVLDCNTQKNQDTCHLSFKACNTNKTKMMNVVHRPSFIGCNTQKTRMMSCTQPGFINCKKKKNHDDECGAHRCSFKVCNTKKRLGGPCLLACDLKNELGR